MNPKRAFSKLYIKCVILFDSVFVRDIFKYTKILDLISNSTHRM